MFERKKALKEIEEKLNTVQMYLEIIIRILRCSHIRMQKKWLSGMRKAVCIKQKDKDMIQKKMAEFDAKLVHYGHTNVSEFLKERY